MATLKLRDIQQHDYDYIQELAINNGCKITKTQWQNRRNKHVVYDYEPYCSYDYDLNIGISGKPTNLNFIQYLYNKRNENIDFLNRCFVLKQEKNSRTILSIFKDGY